MSSGKNKPSDLVDLSDHETAKEIASIEAMTEPELDALLRTQGFDIDALNARLAADEAAAECLRKIVFPKRGTTPKPG